MSKYIRAGDLVTIRGVKGIARVTGDPRVANDSRWDVTFPSGTAMYSGTHDKLLGVRLIVIKENAQNRLGRTLVARADGRGPVWNKYDEVFIDASILKHVKRVKSKPAPPNLAVWRNLCYYRGKPLPCGLPVRYTSHPTSGNKGVRPLHTVGILRQSYDPKIDRNLSVSVGWKVEQRSGQTAPPYIEVLVNKETGEYVPLLKS